MQAPTRRIPSLDGLRAISIFMVIFAHAGLSAHFPPALFKRPSAFLVGPLGVRVFFVISGFLITTLLLNEAKKTGRISLRSFYRRRALRILPVYYFYLLCVVAIFTVTGLHSMPATTYFSAATFTTGIWGDWSLSSWPLLHTWSLSIEEQFYLIWPAMLAFLGPRIGGRIWVPLLILAVPVVRYFYPDNIIVGMLFVYHGDSIACGCLLAIAFARRESAMLRLFQWHPHLMRVAAFVLVYLMPLQAFLLGVHLIGPHDFREFFTVLQPSLQNLAIAFLVGSYVTVQRGFSFQVLNLRFVRWVGVLSYSLYIWQQLVLVPEHAHLFPPDRPVAQWLTAFPQNVGLVLALACLSYYCVEKPFLSLKTKIRAKELGVTPQGAAGA